jgi:hypothetical protein
MSLLKNPTEINSELLLLGIIYGTPGAGKSTLALSAPNPALIDADEGMRRVEKRFQAPSLPMADYATLLELLDSDELDQFDTIIVDTLGRVIERISDYLAAESASNRKRDGSLSLPGYGRLKVEFQRLVRKVRNKRKHLVFVAHSREERDGDLRLIRIDGGPGGSATELIKDLDFIGFMDKISPVERVISFDPCEKFYAKNPWQLPPQIRLPDTNKGNTWIKDYLLPRALARADADEQQNTRYLELLSELDEAVDNVKDAKTANAALKRIQTAPVIWDSRRRARHGLNAKIATVGVVYDREAKTFKKIEKPKEDAETAEPAPAEGQEDAMNEAAE